GCLLVAVPASPDAPHMVDHNYWGRGDTGKRKLDDIEVHRYMEERRLRGEQAESRLHSWVNSPSHHQNTTTDGRVYVVVAPRGGRADQFVDLMYLGDGTLPGAIQAAANAVSAGTSVGLPISTA